MKNVLKIWLRKNELTPDPNDYSGVVSPMGSLSKSALIDAVMEEGTEYKRETVEDIVDRFNRNAAKYSVAGWNVDTGLVYLRAIVTGAFYGKIVDPEKNRVYVSATQGLTIRKEIAQTSIEILGEMPDVMYILQVTNLQTKLPDGTLTRGRNAQVDGSYIKVAGTDATVGVYLVHTESQAEVKLDADCIAVNDPSKLMLLIPADMETGTYQLKIITQYTVGKQLLKAPRQAVFHQDLVVI
jgi:hypothetical protein